MGFDFSNDNGNLAVENLVFSDGSSRNKRETAIGFLTLEEQKNVLQRAIIYLSFLSIALLLFYFFCVRPCTSNKKKKKNKRKDVIETASFDSCEYTYDCPVSRGGKRKASEEGDNNGNGTDGSSCSCSCSCGGCSGGSC